MNLNICGQEINVYIEKWIDTAVQLAQIVGDILICQIVFFEWSKIKSVQSKKIISDSIYAKTREECEEKLAAMIAQVKSEIKAEKKAAESNARTVTGNIQKLSCIKQRIQWKENTLWNCSFKGYFV